MFQNSVLHFSAWRCFYSQDNMEGASQCCLAKITLCSHSQYIRNLLMLEKGHKGGCGSEVNSIYSMFEDEACFIIHLQQQDD